MFMIIIFSLLKFGQQLATCTKEMILSRPWSVHAAVSLKIEKLNVAISDLRGPPVNREYLVSG